MSKEALRVKNFCGLSSINIPVKSINILIGPQGSGKSVIAKLLYFCKDFYAEIIKFVEKNQSIEDFDIYIVNKFCRIFPVETWFANDFKITYVLDDLRIEIVKSNEEKVHITYSNEYTKLFKRASKEFLKLKETSIVTPKFDNLDRAFFYNRINDIVDESISPVVSLSQFYIPAGRSFFAYFQQNIFSILSEDKALDPLLIEFGRFYELVRNVNDSKLSKGIVSPLVGFDDILLGKYVRDDGKDYIAHNDGRKVNLSYASSGQQEVLPLLLIINALRQVNFYWRNATLYIEEPEAHLFPDAQKKLMHWLINSFNYRPGKLQLIITTHSPYILTVLNNLMQAGSIIKEKPEISQEVNSIIPKSEVINLDHISVYLVKNGEAKSIIDKDTELISQTVLDDVSNVISQEFNKLLDLTFHEST